jgi:uncharacterized OB-fold protein
MTDDTRTICKRCGFSNIPGDQFCGSCGAFLEWEGQPTAGAAAAGDPPASPMPPSDPAPDPGASWGAPYGDALPAPVPVPAWPDLEDEDEEDLVRCPACGIANPSSRTFCQSCGATLAAAERVEEASHDQIAAAVAMTPAPTPVAGTTTPTPGSDPQAARRGLPSWVIGVGVIGVLVGVALVLAGVALRGKGPDTGATGSAAAPSGVVSSASPGSSAVAGSSEPGTPVPLVLTGAKASSSVGNRPKFQASMAIDGDLKTSWQEGSQQEKDQWIEVSFDPSLADTLIVRNGYQASPAAYRGNRRLKDVLVSVDGGAPIPVRLKDTTKAQQVDLGGVTGATTVRIMIVSTYAGQATSIQGTPFDDAAVSELSVLGVPGG